MGDNLKNLILIALIFASFESLFSQNIIYNEEFQIDTFTWWADDHTDPSTVGLSDGGFIVCWESEDFHSSYDITAQIYSSNIERKGEEFRVNSFTQGWQRKPTVCSIFGDKVVICWEDASQALYTGVYGQIYSIDGTEIGDEFQINTYNDKWQINVNACGLVNENFVACWQSFEQDGDDYGIFAQIFSNSGEKVGNEFYVNKTTVGKQSSPKAAALNNGGFVVTWESGNDGISYQVNAQLFDKNGFRIGDEFKVSNKLGYEMNPSISSLSDKGFVISWQSSALDIAKYEIYTQIFDDDGEKIGNEILVINSKTNRQTNPDISMITDTTFIISWESGSDIYGKIFLDNGNEFGSKFRVNSFTSKSQAKPIITHLSTDKFLICWQSDGQNLFTDGIFGKYYLTEPIDQKLESFELLQPIYDTLKIDYPKFTWNQATQKQLNYPWELTYDLFIYKDNLNFTPTLINGIQDTIYQIDSLTSGQTYFWKVIARNYAGDSLECSNISTFYIDPDAVSGRIEINSVIPKKYELFQNYPNPFNPSTIIKYEIPEQVRNDNVDLKVYDVQGREVAKLVNENKQPGNYEVEFDATNLPSGIYFYRLKTDSFIKTKKMVLLR